MVRPFVDPEELDQLKMRFESHRVDHIFTQEEISEMRAELETLSIEQGRRSSVLGVCRRILQSEDKSLSDLIAELTAINEDEHQRFSDEISLKTISRRIESVVAKLDLKKEERTEECYCVPDADRAMLIYRPNGEFLQERELRELEIKVIRGEVESIDDVDGVF